MSREPVLKNPGSSPSRPRGCALRGAIHTLEILLLIFYGAVLAISRTDGFRSLLARRMETRLGGGFVAISQSGLTPGFDLILKDVRVRWPDAQGIEAARITEVRASPGWIGWTGGLRVRALRLTGVRLVLPMQASGEMEPPFGVDVTLWLHQLGWPVPEIHSASTGAGPDFWSGFDLPIQIEDSTVLWNESGQPVGSLARLRGQIHPFRMERSSFRYVDLTAVKNPGPDAESLAIRVLMASDAARILSVLP